MVSYLCFLVLAIHLLIFSFFFYKILLENLLALSVIIPVRRIVILFFSIHRPLRQYFFNLFSFILLASLFFCVMFYLSKRIYINPENKVTL